MKSSCHYERSAAISLFKIYTKGLLRLVVPRNDDTSEVSLLYRHTFRFMTENSNIQTDKKLILAEAGRCVACGLCLPHCPTYQLAQLETESPRGRISFISALASGELDASENLNKLLQHCLLCRACEKMCPSSVPFGRLMDKSRHLYRQMVETKSVTNTTVEKLIDFSLRNPEWLRVGARFTWPISRFSRKNIKRAEHNHQRKRSFVDYLPSIQAHKQWKNEYPVDNSDKQVSLFLGCVSRSLDGGTLDDVIYVLNKIGYSVNIPEQQVCCGALSLHAGREKESVAMMQKNIQAFAATELPVIHVASGCGSTLSAYHHYLTDDGFSDRINEACHFVDRHWPEGTVITSRKMKVLLQTPCSLECSSANTSAPFHLLNRFVDIDLQMVSSPYSCCGAAGTTMLTDFNTSNSLRDPVLEQINEERPDVVVSSNIGCALHLSEGLRKAGIDIPVRHPISLVADILRNQLI
ncbi:MAG: 4Fe-4S dicluster domain-containing protein [Planctomycetia bacterium]|nr:4Fe-4S dicluster domain-containing protein [Planctomycetia bacterium]